MLSGNDVPLSIAAGIVFVSGIFFMMVSFLGSRDFIGMSMMSSLRKVNYDDMTEYMSALVCFFGYLIVV